MSDEEQLSAASQRRSRWHVALLANSEYHDQRKNLPGVVDDAARLESCEFYQAAKSKRRWDNLTFEETRERFQQWFEDWKDGDMIMFFFFGHGAYSVEKRTQCMQAVDGWLVDLMSFKDYIQSLRNIRFCGFFACCQNQPSDPDYVCKLFPLSSPIPNINCDTLFHFACRPGQVMYDAPAAQGKCVTEYTSCLIKILCNGRCVSDIPLYLQEKVSEKTCMQQQPECISSFRDCAIWDGETQIASLSSFSACGSAGNEFNALVPDLDLQTLDTFNALVPDLDLQTPDTFNALVPDSDLETPEPFDGRLKDWKLQKAMLERDLEINFGLRTLDTFDDRPPYDWKLQKALLERDLDYEKQKALLERCLKIQEQHDGSEHPEVAKTLLNLGNVCLLVAFDLSVGGAAVDVREVFRTAHLAEVPPVLRNTPAAEQDEEASAQLSPSLDYLRPITDVSAPLSKSSVEMAATAKAEDEQATAVCAEFVEVDPEDEGPTLIVLVRGRPVLIYRAFNSQAEVAFLYTLSVAFLVSIAAAAGLITNSMKGEKADLLKWWLKFIAGTLLIVYSVYMAYVDGWLKPCGLKGPDDDEEDDKEEGLLQTDTSTDSQGKRSNIVVVALLGRTVGTADMTSLDDFTVYLIMAGSGIYTWYELILGTMLGCLILASIVLFLTESAALSHILESIPAWAILLALGVVVLSGLF
ncbi:unnamed protein product [Symbiodinium sp. CCMP2592]|nr:unnamed protein product [Symbiodinium sp. CCMP2592]